MYMHTYSDADVAAGVTQHCQQSQFEYIRIESHQFIIG